MAGESMSEYPEILRLYLYVTLFVFGAVVGSFLNVCIARLPEKKSLVRPGSHCPACSTPIRWYDNVPVLSFIVLRGKCRQCGSSISLQYPTVELLTAVLFVLLVRQFTNPVVLGIYAVFTCSLIVVTFIDFKHYIIPDEISIPGIFIGLAVGLLPRSVTGGQMVNGSFLNSLIGCVVGGGLLYLTALFSLAVFKKEGMGGGDIKLLGMVGAFLGWKLALMTIVLGSVLGAIVGVTLIAVRLKQRTDYIPFGPFLALAATLSLLYGDIIFSLYISMGQGMAELFSIFFS
jgi:leader peptidase (prepilin peptidase)/N-methyltransferase